MSRVLVVDDDRAMCEALELALREEGFDVCATTRPDTALARIQDEDFDAVVSDLNMPGGGGIGLCKSIKAIRPGVPVVLITAFGSMEAAIAALRAGAYDFATKPLNLEDLLATVQRAVEVRKLRREVQDLRKAVAVANFGEMLGDSGPMRALFDMLGRVADQDVTVLIEGETGTGKELVARSLHARSVRSAAPFVTVNCAAVPETLVESELFGHAKGAFTDARSARRGLIFEADGGTLFLDEVGELPLSMQPKLLRALQERKARPVGSDRELPFNVRLIAATNRDLSAEVAGGRFRADLYYRLAVVTVEVPPLRARGNDVLILAQRFLEIAAARSGRPVRGLSREAAERLLAWRWPGNVRELQNAMERAVALARTDEVSVEDLPAALGVVVQEHLSDEVELIPLEEVERRHILRVLDAVGGSKTQAARILGVDRVTLYRKLERYHQSNPGR